MDIEIDWEESVLSRIVGLDSQAVKQRFNDFNAGKQDCQAWSLDTRKIYLFIYFYSSRKIGSGSKEDCEQ